MTIIISVAAEYFTMGMDTPEFYHKVCYMITTQETLYTDLEWVQEFLYPSKDGYDRHTVDWIELDI